MRMSVGMLIVVVLGGCAVPDAKNPDLARLRFVPTAHDSSRGTGASWSALKAFPDDPTVPRVFAHAGVGDVFSVQEQGGPRLFQVLVLEGDDDHLVLQVYDGNGSQNVDLKRDSTVAVQVGGRKYELFYPSVHVGPGSKPTTNQAMIIVMRRP